MEFKEYTEAIDTLNSIGEITEEEKTLLASALVGQMTERHRLEKELRELEEKKVDWIDNYGH